MYIHVMMYYYKLEIVRFKINQVPNGFPGTIPLHSSLSRLKYNCLNSLENMYIHIPPSKFHTDCTYIIHVYNNCSYMYMYCTYMYYMAIIVLTTGPLQVEKKKDSLAYSSRLAY